MTNALFLLQYSLLNGLIIQSKWAAQRPLASRLLMAIPLSWSLNSLTLYLVIRAFDMSFTKANVVFLSALITAIIVVLPRSHDKSL